MKRGLMYTVFAVVIASCGNSGNSESNSDTISPVSGVTDTAGMSGDTTGLNVGAAQPVDSSNRNRPAMGDEPGAKRSGIYDQVDTGARRGVDTGRRNGGQ
jgi:hypothetical protein